MTLKEQALSLYREVFPEDSEAFAKQFTERYFETCCRYIEIDGRPVAMLYLLDCEVFDGENSSAAKYLYAAATHPDFRNKGLMSRLINSAIEEEKIIVTKPANDKIFSFYEKFGFKICAYKNETVKDFPKEEKLTFKQYIALRKRLLKNIPHIMLTDEDFTLDGFNLYGNNDYCAAVDTESKIVKEYIGKDAPHSTKPFAMWTSKKEISVYFGIAMD